MTDRVTRDEHSAADLHAASDHKQTDDSAEHPAAPPPHAQNTTPLF